MNTLLGLGLALSLAINQGIMPAAITNIAEEAKPTTQTQDAFLETPIYASNYAPVKSKRSTLKVYITAYSSSPDETDDTPDITASGSRTRDGVIATNMLPFGTKVRIPRLFGKKLFVVEDRRHSRFSDRVDIWFPEKQDAKNFGIRYAEVEVL